MADEVVASAPIGVGPAFKSLKDANADFWCVSVLAYPTNTGPTGFWAFQNVDATHGLPVAVVGSVAVTGAFWQTTQPVSAASLPLPAGAALEAGNLAAILADTADIEISMVSIDGKIVTCNTGAVVIASGTVTVSGTSTITFATPQHVLVDSGTLTTVSTVTNLAQMGGAAITLNKGASDAGTQRVTLGDGAQSIGSVGTTKGTATETTFAPTTVAALGLAVNANRKESTIVNNGTQTVFFGFTSGVTAASGMPLASGATVEDNAYTGAWYFLTASGTGDLRIVETA